MSNLKKLRVLDAHSNKISEIAQRCFGASNLLKVLRIDQNQISSLHDFAFANSSDLVLVNLTKNILTTLSSCSFAGVSRLLGLLLTFNQISHVEVNRINRLEIEFLKADPSFCCAVSPYVECSTTDLQIYDCTLLPGMGSAVCMWIVSSILFVMDSSSILLQIISFKKGLDKIGASGLPVAFVNFADFFLTASLCVLTAANVHFTNHFFMRSSQWQSGLLCHFIFASFFTFSLLSPLSLVFLSVSRLLIVVHPIDTKVKETKFVRNILIGILAFSVAISVTTTLISWTINSGIPVPLCFPFINNNSSLFTTIFDIDCYDLSKRVVSCYCCFVHQHVACIEEVPRKNQDIYVQRGIQQVLDHAIMSFCTVLCSFLDFKQYCFNCFQFCEDTLSQNFVCLGHCSAYSFTFFGSFLFVCFHNQQKNNLR